MSITTHGFHRYESHCDFVWTVEIPFAERDRHSHVFSYKNHEVYLRFYIIETHDEYYSLDLCTPPSFPFCSTSDMTVQVETKNKSPLNLPNNSGITYSQKTFWCYSEKQLLAAYPDFFKDGVLTFFFRDVDSPKTVSYQKDKSVQKPLCMNGVSCLEKLSSDLSRLLQDQDQDQICRPDVKLLLGDQTIRAHSLVLSTRSKIFSRMLQTDMSEGRNGQIEVKDMELDVFEQFVRYLYTGKLPFDLNVDTARGLYEASDQYEVPSLMRRCSSFLEENLTPDNACEMLFLADAHSDREFKRSVTGYVLKEEIPLLDHHWLAFCESHPTLANEVLNLSYKQQRTV